jgi:two-component system LytT family response regulator
MRALVVDDEPLARRGIILRLRKFKDVEIVGECADGASAVEKILDLSPDVVFLDVQMPGMDGFEVVRALPESDLHGIIFVSAYERHAMQAFEVHALDYLLKPLNDERFADAIDRARRILTDSSSKKVTAAQVMRMLERTTDKYLSRFPVHTGSRIHIVRTDDVEWIAAAGDYVELHGSGRSHLFRGTMGSLEKSLDPRQFIRIHRCRIVRAANIRELRSIENREFIVRLSDGSEHRSSRTYADRLDRWLLSH